MRGWSDVSAAKRLHQFQAQAQMVDARGFHALNGARCRRVMLSRQLAWRLASIETVSPEPDAEAERRSHRPVAFASTCRCLGFGIMRKSSSILSCHSVASERGCDMSFPLPWQPASGIGVAARQGAFSLETPMTRENRSIASERCFAWAVFGPRRAKANRRHRESTVPPVQRRWHSCI